MNKMNNNFRFRWSSSVALLCVAGLLSACAFPPQGPRVTIMPMPGKPLELFEQEDQYCRGYAEQHLGPDKRADNAVAAAVVGTLIGAAVGSATSTRHYNNTGFGAATGLVMGSAIGANSSASEGLSLQQQYDNAYEQCMVSKNNLSAHSRPFNGIGQGMTYVVPAMPAPVAQTAPGYYPPPPPAGSPPVPATGSAPPPPPPGSPPPPPPQ